MAKTKREFVLATFFLSGAAAVLSFVALGTQGWVIGNAVFDGDTQLNPVSFGLFKGTFEQTYGFPGTFELDLTCLFDKNICALLCGSMERQKSDLEKLYNNQDVSFDESTCVKIDATRGLKKNLKADADNDKYFINAGLWLSTLLFLIISGIFGLISASLAVWNTASNPYQVYFSIYGMYFYNGIAACFATLTVILWGALFATSITHNVPTYQTLTDQNFITDGKVQLGYSFWINIVSIVLYIDSICVLYLRHYLISKEPVKNVNLDDNSDPVLYLY